MENIGLEPTTSCVPQWQTRLSMIFHRYQKLGIIGFVW